jgi:hypothetical protein
MVQSKLEQISGETNENTATGVWGLGLWVRHTDPEDVSSPEGPRVRERIALRTLTFTYVNRL